VEITSREPGAIAEQPSRPAGGPEPGAGSRDKKLALPPDIPARVSPGIVQPSLEPGAPAEVQPRVDALPLHPPRSPRASPPAPAQPAQEPPSPAQNFSVADKASSPPEPVPVRRTIQAPEPFVLRETDQPSGPAPAPTEAEQPPPPRDRGEQSPP